MIVPLLCFTGNAVYKSLTSDLCNADSNDNDILLIYGTINNCNDMMLVTIVPSTNNI